LSPEILNALTRSRSYGIQRRKFLTTANFAASQASTKESQSPLCLVASVQPVSIAINEAASIGVHTFVRVGSTAAIQENIECGDLIFSSAAVRLDGTSNCYIMPEYPAVASFEVLQALIEAAESLGIKNYHVSITATTADFYAGQSRHTTANYQSSTENLLSLLKRAKVLNFEMETATLFTLASLYGLRAGSVCAVFANRCRNEFRTEAGEENAMMVANEAIKILREWDKKKMREERRWLFPSLVNTR